MTLEERYQEIEQHVADRSDFSVESLAPSRHLFNLETDQIVPRWFDVWTLVVGLPLPPALTYQFQQLITRITKNLPTNQRVYKVRPENYHWELFIIQRPEERVHEDSLHQIPHCLKEIFVQQPPLTLAYQGFLITPDGTIIVKGYGNFEPLRRQLRDQLPWASPQQSNLGHISLGRFLDPVGDDYFAELKGLIKASQNEFYGELNVQSVQYIHEHQWYMETKETIAVFPFGTGSTMN